MMHNEETDIIVPPSAAETVRVIRQMYSIARRYGLPSLALTRAQVLDLTGLVLPLGLADGEMLGLPFYVTPDLA